jgi:flagellar protein FlaI
MLALKDKIVMNLSPSIPALPRIEDKKIIDLRYMLISPYASAHIFFDAILSELVYELEEPVLNQEEKNLLLTIEKGMKEIINLNVLVERTQEAMIAYLDKTARFLISELGLDVAESSYKKMFYYLFRDFIGLNEIEPLTRDYFIKTLNAME